MNKSSNKEWAEATIVAAKTDGPGRVATIASWLEKKNASISLSESRRTRDGDYKVRVHFHCTPAQMEVIEKSYREELFGYSVELERHDVMHLESPHIVRLVTHDKAGIEATLMTYFATLGLNIAKHRGMASQLPICSDGAYVVDVWFDLPALINRDELEKALEKLADEQQWMDILLYTEDEHINNTLTHQIDIVSERQRRVGKA